MSSSRVARMFKGAALLPRIRALLRFCFGESAAHNLPHQVDLAAGGQLQFNGPTLCEVTEPTSSVLGPFVTDVEIDTIVSSLCRHAAGEVIETGMRHVWFHEHPRGACGRNTGCGTKDPSLTAAGRRPDPAGQQPDRRPFHQGRNKYG